MEERIWIIACVSIIASRIELLPGEILIATKHGRLVIDLEPPTLGGLLVLRTGNDAVRPTAMEMNRRLAQHMFETL